MTTTITATTRVRVFAEHLHRHGLSGRLVTPGDDGWDDARTPWQLAVDQRPEAVIVAASVGDVVATVRAAAAAGLTVAPQATGHNANPLGDLAGSVLLRTSGLRDVTVDPERRVARIGAGAVWAEVTAAAAAVGLAGLAGSSRDVGVTGYTLGGGLSFLARAHGLASDHLLAADVVTPDGRLRHVDATHEPELFWALRGGFGAGAAIVVALELALLPVTEVYAGLLFWPIERATDVLTAWRELLPGLPDQITSTARLLRFPPVADLPEAVRGRSFAVVDLISLLDAATTDRIVAPLRALGPTLDTLRVLPAAELGDLHMDPPAPVPATTGGGTPLRTLAPEAVAALLAAAGPGTDTDLLAVELRHLGGALTPGRVEGRGALPGLDGEVLWFTAALTPDAAAVAHAEAQMRRIRAALAPWGAERAFANFTESSRPPLAFFDEATIARLRAVKAVYDPTDLIRAHHPVTTLTEQESRPSPPCPPPPTRATPPRRTATGAACRSSRPSPG